jgi:hypothetical protein
VALTGISLFALTIKVPERTWGAKPAGPPANPASSAPSPTGEPAATPAK